MPATFNNGSIGLYLIAGAVILFVLIQSIFFLVKAWKQGKKLGLDKSKLRNAVTSSALFTIPSALSVLATVIVLMPSLGLVIPWVRLSVIGNLMYETTAAEAAMEAFGHKGGLTAEVTDPTAYAGIAWVMTLGICFALVLLPFLAKPLHKKFMAASNKEQKADIAKDEADAGKKKRTFGEFVNKFATPAIFIGLIGAFIARSINGRGQLDDNKQPIFGDGDGAGVLSVCTLVIAIVFSILLEILVKKLKLTWLEPFIMPIGMIVAMISAIVLYNVLPADIATLEWRG